MPKSTSENLYCSFSETKRYKIWEIMNPCCGKKSSCIASAFLMCFSNPCEGKMGFSNFFSMMQQTRNWDNKKPNNQNHPFFVLLNSLKSPWMIQKKNFSRASYLSLWQATIKVFYLIFCCFLCCFLVNCMKNQWVLIWPQHNRSNPSLSTTHLCVRTLNTRSREKVATFQEEIKCFPVFQFTFNF